MLGQQMIKWGTGDANVVYGMLGSGTPFWRHAKERGLKIAVDMFITPLCHRIVAREQEAFPDWEDAAKSIASNCTISDQLTRETIQAADLLLCPSPAVLDHLQTFAHECSPTIDTMPRSVVVPYGAAVSHVGRRAPIPGRVLFAGGADLRKGIHYLARAGESLIDSGHGYEFRIAGFVTERVRNHPAARALTFLGQLSREQLIEEYARADVFVLPTLAEGSAEVVFEALAAGLPVVTTRSAGSVVVHCKQGLIVPERDSDALALAIEKIIRDRTLRDTMAQAAITTAADFDEGPWGQRLVQALASLVN